MKHLIVAFSVLLAMPLPAFAQEPFSFEDLIQTTQADPALVQRLQGRILLQVEQHGEAWFVHEDGHRYYLKNGSAAYQAMRDFGLGITDTDLATIPAVASVEEYATAKPACSSALAERLKGKILLQVQQHGEAWYVDPPSCRRVYMKDGEAAYAIMRLRGLGITNADLEGIPQGISMASICDDFAEEDDGVVHSFQCFRTDDRETTGVSISENRVTGLTDVSLFLGIHKEDQWIELDGTQVSMVPFMLALACTGMDEMTKSGTEDFAFAMRMTDIATGETLGSCQMHTGFTPTFVDNQHLSMEESFGGIVLGEPIDFERIQILLMDTIVLDSLGQVIPFHLLDGVL